MPPVAGLHISLGADLEDKRRECESSGWRVFVLPHDITDRDSFFRGVRDVCPLDPPLFRNDNWDALSDSVWNGLDSLEVVKLAIIWPESSAMAASAPDAFSIARETLSSIAASLGDHNATVGHPKQVAVLLL